MRSNVNLPEIIIPRFCLPEKRAEKGKIRLICLADAAEFAGGKKFAAQISLLLNLIASRKQVKPQITWG